MSRQLQQVINENAAQGWEFFTLNDVNVEIQPGCLGRLFGGETSYASQDQVIFRHEVSA